jgi:hypothetical protein
VKRFNYRDAGVEEEITDFVTEREGSAVAFILDCIGSVEGSVASISGTT